MDHGLVHNARPHEPTLRADVSPRRNHVDFRDGAGGVVEQRGQRGELSGDGLKNGLLEVRDDGADVAVLLGVRGLPLPYLVEIRGDFRLVVDGVFGVELVREIGGESGVSVSDMEKQEEREGREIGVNRLCGRERNRQHVSNYAVSAPRLPYSVGDIRTPSSRRRAATPLLGDAGGGGAWWRRCTRRAA